MRCNFFQTCLWKLNELKRGVGTFSGCVCGNKLACHKLYVKTKSRPNSNQLISERMKQSSTETYRANMFSLDRV